MEDTQIIQWVLDHHNLIASTQKPNKEEADTIFQIANIVDSTQTHRPTSCGRCLQSAKNAIKRNLPTLFEKK